MKLIQPRSPFPKEVYQRNAEIYKLLANPIRLEILNIIKTREATVDELSDIVGIRRANTSQHLSILRHLKVVKVRRNGKNIYYRIANPLIVEPCRILKEIWGDASLQTLFKSLFIISPPISMTLNIASQYAIVIMVSYNRNCEYVPSTKDVDPLICGLIND